MKYGTGGTLPDVKRFLSTREFCLKSLWMSKYNARISSKAHWQALHSTLQARRAKNRAQIIIDRVYENFSQKIRTGRGAPVVWDGIEFVEQCTDKNAVKTCSIYEDDPANIRIFGRMQAAKRTFQKSHFPGDSGRFSDVNSGFYVFLTGFEAFGKLWSPFRNVSGAFSLLRLPLEIWKMRYLKRLGGIENIVFYDLTPENS